MKNFYFATLLSIISFAFSTPSFSQCNIISTNGYVVHVTIIPGNVIVSSADCPNGYNYNIGYSYNVTFTGINIPSSLYTLQTLINCNGQINGGYTMPLSGGSGTSVTSTNPYISNSGAAYSYVGKPNCNQATVQTLQCNNISVIIQGPGIPYQTVSCNYSGIALPVELVDYQGTATETEVNLNWSTASERNNDRYSILRSTDGYTWSEIAQVKGAGTTADYKEYSYADRSPENGINYYKLTQTDFDGDVKEQGVVGIEFFRETTSTTSVFPNPSSGGNVSVRVTATEDDPITINVRNEFGRLVQTQEMAVPEKSSGRFVVQESIQLPQEKQVYFLEVAQNGNALGRHKVVVL